MYLLIISKIDSMLEEENVDWLSLVDRFLLLQKILMITQISN